MSEETNEPQPQLTPEPLKRKRGRPKGSKNKPKVAAKQATTEESPKVTSSPAVKVTIIPALDSDAESEVSVEETTAE